jgi:hypothetical protein
VEEAVELVQQEAHQQMPQQFPVVTEEQEQLHLSLAHLLLMLVVAVLLEM